MKAKYAAAFAALSIGTLNAAPPAIPSVPSAAFQVTPTVVQTGTKPTLIWSILFPSTVNSVAFIQPPGTITLSQNNTYVSVQPLGTTTNFTEARISTNGSAYDQLFYGTSSDVDPSFSLFIKKMNKGETLDFGGRFVNQQAQWTPFYTTKSSSARVVVLTNGQSIPTIVSIGANTASFLKPYTTGNGKVNCGPMSALVLFELGSESRLSPNFDYQELALLVTFSTNHPNNGHGNNLDGVDSSNPGKGSGGPNGAVDPSGGVDDEAR